MVLLMLHEIISNDRDKDDCLDSKLRMKFNRRKRKVYVWSKLPQQLQHCKISVLLSHIQSQNKIKTNNYKPNFHLGMHLRFLVTTKETLRRKMKEGPKMWDNCKNTTPHIPKGHSRTLNDWINKTTSKAPSACRGGKRTCYIWASCRPGM